MELYLAGADKFGKEEVKSVYETLFSWDGRILCRQG